MWPMKRRAVVRKRGASIVAEVVRILRPKENLVG